MKILFVSTFYYPNMPGGAEQSIKLLAEGLVQRGNEVAVYTGDSKDGKTFCNEVYNGVKVYRCTTGKFNLYRFSYEKTRVGKIEKIEQKLLTYYNKVSTNDFKRVCNDFKPDVIHSNTLFGLPCTLWKTAYKMGIPVVHTIRDTAITSSVQYGHKVLPIIEKIHQLYMCYYSKFVTGVTAPSEYTLSSSLKIGSFKRAKEKKCIFNSISVDIPLLEKMVIERKNRTSELIKFMYAGRLIDIKGIKTMINALKQTNNPNVELHICGNGELKGFVLEKAEEDRRIVYCGKLNNYELEKKYIECDVLLVPSEWPEPFGRVVIEGNKYGMPVIATSCGGISEIFDVLHGGELYPCGNIEQLAERMNAFCDRKKYFNYYDNIRKGIEIFDIDKQIKSFSSLYSSIMKNHGDR